MTYEVALAVVTSLAAQGPMLLALLGGLLYALVRFRRHRSASVLVALGCAVLLFEQVAIAALYVILPLFYTGWTTYAPYSTTSGSTLDIMTVYRIGGVVQAVLYAVGVAFLAAAALVSRSPAEPQP